MKARYLLSLWAAIACPAMVSAQAPGPGPDAPPTPPANRDARPPGDRASDPSKGRPEHGRHHRHFAKQRDGGPGQAGQPGDPRERLGHLREAIQHLRAAGMNDVAEAVEGQARRILEESRNRPDGPRGNSGPNMQGRPGPGNFAAPQGAYDVRAQLDRVMRDVQELRMEMLRMRDGNRDRDRDGRPDGARPPGDSPRGMRPPFQRPQKNDNGPRDGERQRGERRDGDGPNQPSRGDRPPGPGRPDGANQGPGPQDQRPPFPRPEWRDHSGANAAPQRGERRDDDRRDGDRRGERLDGSKPPPPPQGDRPKNAPANEGSLQDILPLPPESAQE